MSDSMDRNSSKSNDNATRMTSGLYGVLEAAFRRIAVPEHADEAVQQLFSSLPFCWEDVEAGFPSLNRIDAAKHLTRRLKDPDLGTLYETLFALHPGLKHTIHPNWRPDRSPVEQAEEFLASLTKSDGSGKNYGPADSADLPDVAASGKVKTDSEKEIGRQSADAEIPERQTLDDASSELIGAGLGLSGGDEAWLTELSAWRGHSSGSGGAVAEFQVEICDADGKPTGRKTARLCEPLCVTHDGELYVHIRVPDFERANESWQLVVEWVEGGKTRRQTAELKGGEAIVYGDPPGGDATPRPIALDSIRLFIAKS